MNSIVEDILMHYGMPRRSGRYPYGSGENPYQHSGDFLSRVQELKKSGMSETDIAKNMGLTTTQLRTQMSLAMGVVVNCMNLNIRKDPTQASRSLGIIGSDTVVNVCDDESVSGFYKVKTGDGISGYCMSEFIKLC